MKKRIFFISIITFILLQIPYLGTFFEVINTMLHESGHAFAAVFTNGDVGSIKLFSNLEGVTTSSTSSWIGAIITTLSGYVFASFMVFVLSWLYKRDKYKTITVILLSISIINLVFWVRNLFGIAWLILFIIGLVFLLKTKKQKFVSYILLTFITVTFVASINSTLDIIVLSFQNSKEAGDASGMRGHTFIPSQVWALFFFVQSTIFGGLSIRALLSANTPKTDDEGLD